MGPTTMARCRMVALLGWCLTGFPGAAAAQSEPASEGTGDEGLFGGRTRLTGDWGGLRSGLRDRGVEVDGIYSGYWQGLLSASESADEFRWGNRLDALVDIDLESLGLWGGGSIHTHVTYRWGAEGQRGGALWPVNSAMWLPIDADERLVAGALYLRQQVGESSSIAVGKFEVIDFLAADPHFGGWGVYRFMNLSAMAPASGLFPPFVIGAQATHRAGPYSVALFAYDPADRSTDYFFADDLFDNGVNFNLAVTRSGTLFGRSTNLTLNGIYSTRVGTDLREPVLPPEVPPATRRGSWAYSAQVSHQLLSRDDDATGGLWFYAKGLNGDGNPNYVDGYVSLGFSAKGTFPGRPNDAAGLSYYYFDFSDDLQEAVAPDVDFDDEVGVELYYMSSPVAFMRLGLDVQWIDPGTGTRTDFWTATFRVVVDL